MLLFCSSHQILRTSNGNEWSLHWMEQENLTLPQCWFPQWICADNFMTRMSQQMEDSSPKQPNTIVDIKALTQWEENTKKIREKDQKSFLSWMCLKNALIPCQSLTAWPMKGCKNFVPWCLWLGDLLWRVHVAKQLLVIFMPAHNLMDQAINWVIAMPLSPFRIVNNFSIVRLHLFC